MTDITIRSFVPTEELTAREVINTLNGKNYVHLSNGKTRYMKLSLTKWGTFQFKLDGKARYVQIEMFSTKSGLRSLRFTECAIDDINADGSRRTSDAA